MLIDTHCHLHDPEWFSSEQSELFLQEARENGVQKIICIGTNPQDSETARNYANAHEDVYWTYGIHPEFASQYEECVADLGNRQCSCLRAFGGLVAGNGQSSRSGSSGGSAEAKRRDPATAGVANAGPDEKIVRSPAGVALCSEKTNNSSIDGKLVAIGEIGLDYHYDGYDRTAQIHLFEQMLQLALGLNLPVSLHIREAFSDALAVIDNFPKTRGVVHSFTGSKRDLRQALERNFYIGVNGLCTYTTNPLPPLEKMVLETDAPFLTPVPFRGTINKPGYVKTIATYLAEKLGVAESNLVEQTTQNARNIFQI